MSIQTIMMADESGSELVSFARATAQRLVKDRLNRSQIRNIFTEVRQIEAMWPHPDALRRLNMLKPKLSYSTARAKEVQYLETVLSEAIDLVNRAESPEVRHQRFERFMDLFEAILAYHRSEGGRN